MKFLQINYIFIIIIFFIFSCGNKEKIHISKTIIFEENLYKIDDEAPFSGFVYNNYDSGEIEYKGEYNEGKPNGWLIYWFVNGNKMREGKLKNGSPIGLWKYYNDDGTLDKKIQY